MDDDCLPEPDALEKFMEADIILKGEYGWLSSVALWIDGNECRMNRQKLKKSYYEYIPYMRYGLVQAEQATFVSLFLKSKTIERVGLPIKEFYIWGDDIEFTRRIAVREKYPSFVVGQSYVVHAMMANNGSSISLDSVERLNRYNYAFRNENYLYRREGIRGFCYYLGKCGKNIFCSILQAKDYRLRRCGIIIKQMVLGLFFNPKVEYVDYYRQ
jgi:GT2 family glycosyltransferase